MRIYNIIFTILLFSFTASSQFVTMVSALDGILLAGQSNTGFFRDGGGIDSLILGLKELHPTKNYSAVMYGRGGTNLAQHAPLDWNAKSISEYSDSIVFTANGFKNAIPHFVTSGDGEAWGFYRNGQYDGILKRAVTPKYILWIQGENDSQIEEHANAYQENLINLFAKIKDQLNTPDLKFICVKLSPLYQGTYKDTINTAFDNIAISDENVGVVSTDNFTSDDYVSPVNLVHYSAQGALKVATTMVALINSKNW